MMNVLTGEADLYLCSDGTETYVATIYRRKVAIREEVIEKLQSIDFPYVAKMYATGEICKGKNFHINSLNQRLFQL